MAPLRSLIVSSVLLLSCSRAVVLPTSDLMPASITPTQTSQINNASQKFGSEATTVHSAAHERRGFRPEWLDCHRLRNSTEWGDVFTGCYSEDAPKGYEARELDQFQKQLTELINTAIGPGTVSDRFHSKIDNEPRWRCTSEQNKKLCISWTSDLQCAIDPDQTLIALEKARHCLYKHGYSSQSSLFTYEGERFHLCISDKPGECDRPLCGAA